MSKRIRCSRIISKVVALSTFKIVSCFLFVGIVVSAETKDSVRLRIGRGYGGNVTLYSPTDPSKKYHVLTEEGATLYIGGKIFEDEEDSCGDVADKSIWTVIPERSGFEELVHGTLIVVETSSVVPYKPVHRESLKLPKTVIHDYISHLSLPQILKDHFQPGKYQYVTFSAGEWKGRKRIILFTAPSRSELTLVDQAGGNAILSVADIVMGKLKENFTRLLVVFDNTDQSMSIVNSNQDTLVRYIDLFFKSMADINRDGLADVFLTEDGSDYPVYDLYIEEGTNKWRVQKDDFGPPC